MEGEEEPLLPPTYNDVIRQRILKTNEGDLPSQFTRRDKVLSHIKHSYSFKSLFAVKPIDAFLLDRESRPAGHSLAEKLGLSDLLGYGVGCTVGAGIYSLIGVGAGIAGISWLCVYMLYISRYGETSK